MPKRSRRMLLMSDSSDRLNRWSSFLEAFDLKVMRAQSLDVARQFFGTVPIDIALADDSCVKGFESLRRNQSDVCCIHATDSVSRRGDADFAMLTPVDLFVLEKYLVEKVGVRRAASSDGGQAAAEPLRERETVAAQ
jgi:hypothetical protein